MNKDVYKSLRRSLYSAVYRLIRTHDTPGTQIYTLQSYDFTDDCRSTIGLAYYYCMLDLGR